MLLLTLEDLASPIGPILVDVAFRKAGIKRRAWIAGLVGAAASVALPGCRRSSRSGLRVGYMPNLTHAVPIVAGARGLFSQNVRHKLELIAFNAGPAAVEALLACDVDLVYCGPGPAVNAFIRTHGRVRVLSGACDGGASFVVRADLPIDDASDLSHRRLATPQIGNSQDIALRRYLWENDLSPADRGGTVTVVPMASSDILSLMASKDLDGAWVPEPWASRLVAEAGGRVFLDEATLWPDGRFPTTILVTTSEALTRRREAMAGILEANHQAIAWISGHGADARKLVNEELKQMTGKKLADPIIASAWKRLSFTEDPELAALRETARFAKRIGYLPTSDIRGIAVSAAELQPLAKGPSR
jgi:NitT/TauT family transport system substrate-binding protein